MLEVRRGGLIKWEKNEGLFSGMEDFRVRIKDE
jgi:hypothetical protein